MFTGDNLPVLRGLEPESVDMVYADPPFNSGREFSAPIGSKAAGAMFRDAWTLDQVDVAWSGEIRAMAPAVAAHLEAAELSAGGPMRAYLSFMAVRLLEIKRILKPSGSFYLHCDDAADAYLKVLLDAIFGPDAFTNAVVWQRTRGKTAPGRFARLTDRILFYRGSDATWNQPYEPYGEGYVETTFRFEDEHGRYAAGDMTGSKKGGVEAYLPLRGVSPPAGRAWVPPVRAKLPPSVQRLLPDDYEKLNQLAKCEALDAIGQIHWSTGGKPHYKRYLSQARGIPAGDCITDVQPAKGGERTGYPTQKPLRLLKRFIRASTNPGNVVLDPFAGCATALVAAESLGREWIGIDVSPVAVRLVRERMRDELGLFGIDVIERTDVPRRTGKRSPNIRQLLYGKQDGNCNLCRVHFESRNLTVDHIVPSAHGGPDDDDNLQLLCGACNSAKGTGTMTEAIARLRAQGTLRA